MESVTEESIVSVKNEVDYIICSRDIEAITEPIDCHLSRCHGVKHEVLQVLQGLGIGKECFVHVYTIHDLGCCAYFVCHLSDRPPAADQFVLLSSRMFG